MASVKELRGRIKSIGSIRQITRAMEMVATTKLRRFQDRAVASRPYAQEITGLVARLAGVLGDELAGLADGSGAGSPALGGSEGAQVWDLFQPGGGDKVLVLLVTSDRGLCGPYNSHLLRAFEEWRAEQGREVDYFVYGRKGYQYLTKRGHDVRRYLTDPPLESVDYRNASIASHMLTEEFRSGEYAEVWMVYTAFESMVKYVPTFVPLLPIRSEALAAEAEAGPADVILEPDPVTIFFELIPRYLETRIYNALIEALTSEYASRRFAMKNATDAATDMQKVLRGIYNRKRQENITKELLDIVGGAEALR